MPVEGKKMIMLAILEILRNHSDEGHRLLQADIIEWLRRDYDLTATRKTVRQNLAELQDAGYPLEYGKDEECGSGWYYEHEFTAAELDLLVQGVLFNGFISPAQRKEMIRKLQQLGGEHYTPRTFFDSVRPANPDFIFTMGIVQEAVEHGRKIEFQYMDFDVDKKLHPRLDQKGEPRRYLVNPYRVVMSNGRYYLIGNVDKYDDIAHFRLDRISKCRETDAPAKPMAEVRGLENGLHIPEYMAGRVYMFTGRPTLARVRAKRSLVGDILDWFGMDVRFENITEDAVEAVFRAEEESLKYWLRQYGEYAERVE